MKKESEVKKETYKGVYYSEPFSMESGTPGEPPIDYLRMFMYIDEDNNTFVFHSKWPVSKAINKFLKNPTKYTEEMGQFENANGSVYIKTHFVDNQYSAIRYVGECISENSIFIDYKAAQNYKKGLYIYLYKYSN